MSGMESGQSAELSLLSPCSLADFDVIRTIGCGAASRVQLAVHRTTSEAIALKVFSKQQILTKNQLRRVSNERSILSSLRHPFLIQYRGAFQDSCHLYIALEFTGGGELYRLLQRKMAFDTEDARFYACEVLSAISYLHSHNILYRDLKPENVMLTAGGHVKLVDFGAARTINGDVPASTMCGTPEYMAPEMVTQGRHSFPCDMWSFGIFLYELLLGHTPFQDENPMGLYAKILNQEVRFPKRFDEKIRTLILGLLARTPQTRLDESAVKNHSFFKAVNWTDVDQLALRPPYVPLFRHPTDTCNFDTVPEVPDFSGVCEDQVWEGF